MCVCLFGLYSWYLAGRDSSLHLNPDFELFIAEKVFKDYDVWEYEDRDETSKEIPFEVWRMDVNLDAPETKWLLSKEGFERLDSLTVGISNESNSKFYYMSWGEPNSRLRKDLVIHRSSGSDTIEFGGFGCGTGIYLQALEKETSAIGTIMNPLCFNPYNGYELPLSVDTLPNMLRNIYGDSVSIRLSLATYSLPWSSNESQIISSPWLTISTEKMIENWREGNFAKAQYLDEYTKEFYGMTN